MMNSRIPGLHYLVTGLAVCLLACAVEPLQAAGSPLEEGPYPHGPATDAYGQKAMPFEAPVSPWYDTERAQYRKVLLRSRYDYLVVPFQVQDFAFDRVARARLSRTVATLVRERTGGIVADPDLVARALGHPLRRYDPAEVYKLAWEMQPKAIVWLYVGHDAASHPSATVTVGLEFADSKVENYPWSLRKASAVYRTVSDLSFTDELPLSSVASGILPAMLDGLPAEKRQPVGRKRFDSTPELAIGDLLDKIDQHRSLLEEAHLLQLLAVLHPFDTSNGFADNLFLRSLAILDRIDPASVDYRLLRARAWLHLHRRPVALKELGVPQTPEEQFLLAVMNGNLPESTALLAQIERPMQRIIALAEQQDMRSEYRKSRPDKAQYQAILEQFPGMEWFLYRRLTDRRYRVLQSNLEPKLVLDEWFPIAGYGLEQLVAGAQASGDSVEQIVDTAVIAHVRKIRAGDAWTVPDDDSRASRRDVLALLESIGESNLMKAVNYQKHILGSPARGLKLIERYESVFGGHPLLAAYKAEILGKQLTRADDMQRENLKNQTRQQAEIAFYWSGGQAPGSLSAYNILAPMGLYKGSDIVAYDADFPVRWYWPGVDIPWSDLPEELAAAGKSGVFLGAAPVQLRYAVDNTYPLRLLLRQLQRYPVLVDNLLRQNESRFAGSPERQDYLAARLEARGDEEGLRRLYQQAIEQDPVTWGPYFKLAQFEINHSNYDTASAIYWQYPFFHEPGDANPADVANNAYLAAISLYRTVRYDLSVPLMRLAVESEAGGLGGRLSCAVHLAEIEQRYADALPIALERATLVDNPYAQNIYLSLLHTQGRHKEAWSVFEQVYARYSTPQVWTSALTGHRMQGRALADLSDWLDGHNQSGRGPASAARFAALYGVIDRDNSAVDLQHLEQQIVSLEKATGASHPYPPCQGRDYKPTIDSAWRTIPHKDPAAVRLMNLFDDAVLNCASDIRYPGVTLALASAAIQHGDYEQAYAMLREHFRAFGFYWGRSKKGPMLMYLVWSGIKTGQVDEVSDYLGRIKVDGLSPVEFQVLLADGLLAHHDGRFDDALALLEQAFNRRLVTDQLPLPVEYQSLEVLEWLFVDSGDARYRDLLLQQAHLAQVASAWNAWAYAFEAKYTTDADARIRALAMTLYLDPASARIAAFSKAERQRARQWLDNNNPFLKPATPALPEQRAGNGGKQRGVVAVAG